MGKKIWIEAFRGYPDLAGGRGYRYEITPEDKEKAKIVKKLTTDLFISTMGA